MRVGEVRPKAALADHRGARETAAVGVLNGGIEKGAHMRHAVQLMLVLVLLASLAFSPAVISVAAGGAAETEPIQFRVTVLDPAAELPYLIPEAALNEEPLEQLLPEERKRRLLLWRWERALEPSIRAGDPLTYPRCQGQQAPLRQGTASSPVTMDELLSRHSELFVGEVVAVIHGWSPVHHAAARAIYLQVDRPWRGSLVESQLVTYIVEGGSFSYNGAVICDEGRPEFFWPQPGDHLLVGGYLHKQAVSNAAAPEIVVARHVFPILGTAATPQPYPHLKKSEGARHISDLKSQVLSKSGEAQQ
jgi:hypothetical protein